MGKVLIIQARFYEDIADNLLDAATSVCTERGFDYDVVDVPGCFEVPAAVSMAIDSGKYNGYIALGCVIRGETTHYDYVCGESARGLNDVAVNNKVAIGYGIVTAENKQQALVRADKSQKNVGGRAAIACIEMIKLRNNLLGR